MTEKTKLTVASHLFTADPDLPPDHHGRHICICGLPDGHARHALPEVPAQTAHRRRYGDE